VIYLELNRSIDHKSFFFTIVKKHWKNVDTKPKN